MMAVGRPLIDDVPCGACTNPRVAGRFDPRDLEDRNLWDEYEAAYEIMLHKVLDTLGAMVRHPRDRKWARIAASVRETLEAMNPQYLVLDWDPKNFKIE